MLSCKYFHWRTPPFFVWIHPCKCKQENKHYTNKYITLCHKQRHGNLICVIFMREMNCELSRHFNFNLEGILDGFLICLRLCGIFWKGNQVVMLFNLVLVELMSCGLGWLKESTSFIVNNLVLISLWLRYWNRMELAVY